MFYHSHCFSCENWEDLMWLYLRGLTLAGPSWLVEVTCFCSICWCPEMISVDALVSYPFLSISSWIFPHTAQRMWEWAEGRSATHTILSLVPALSDGDRRAAACSRSRHALHCYPREQLRDTWCRSPLRRSGSHYLCSMSVTWWNVSCQMLYTRSWLRWKSGHADTDNCSPRWSKFADRL